MLALSTLTDIRDIAIIVFSVASAVALLVLIVLTMLIGLVSLGLLKAIRRTVDEDVKPIIASAQETARSAQGTAGFVSDSLVAPFIKVYGVASGLKRGFAVLARGRGR